MPENLSNNKPVKTHKKSNNDNNIDKDNKKEDIEKILEYMNITLEEGESLADYAKLTGNDLEDIQKRKFLANLVIAKKLGFLSNDVFIDVFNYRKV